MTTWRRRLRSLLIAAAITLSLFVAGGEIGLRFFFPQPMLFPRWVHSPAYGTELPKNTVMRHWRAGHWDYRYTINGYGMRGALTLLSNRYRHENLLVLGDSYAMGMGVQDGEEFPAVLAQSLDGNYTVVNAACAGWGLTQQIRRYYEFGRLYDPRVVVLQFCANDPEDNVRDPVTAWDRDRFVFHNTPTVPNPLFKAFSGSYIMQHSQIYALIRSRYEQRREARLAHASADTAALSEAYNGLLAPFASDLANRGILFIVISVTGQLNEYPAIYGEVMRLHREGILRYVEVAPWLDGEAARPSPEGHVWGAAAHRAIGENLARKILALMPPPARISTP